VRRAHKKGKKGKEREERKESLKKSPSLWYHTILYLVGGFEELS
jgi:hypothetical protein